MSHTFALLMPVKTLTLAKSRLEVSHPEQREPLMRAFALDAITAATRATTVGRRSVETSRSG
jgi:2-phospho-L-lactate guanylyltransferase